eukprot:TRINITY_DN15347_c0_g1_i1.p1 TRINITY_DN15347_c0_g1~~TRINITY_DN15347_c0_g1_i1.p1  ORF type:complete len:281 (+),score=43.89 TRINITY_DN15347_c0_g1_i1:35-844(+)
MAGKTSESIVEVATLGAPFVIDGKHEVFTATANGEVVIAFAVETQDEVDLVVAYRAVGGFPMTNHDARIAVRVGDVNTVSIPADNSAKARTHGTVLAIIWSYVVPSAIIVKSLGLRLGMVAGYPLAFLLHGFLMFASVSVTTVFVGLSLAEFRSETTHAHRALGIALVCISWAQVFLGLAAPPKDHYARFAFQLTHIAIGLGIMGMAVAQQVTGLYNMKMLYSESTAELQLLIVLVGVSVCFLAAVGVGSINRNPPQKSAEPANEPVNA